MENKEEILIGSLFELVIKDRSEEEQNDEFQKIGKYWHEKGYDVMSGKVDEGKVDELWAVKILKNENRS